MANVVWPQSLCPRSFSLTLNTSMRSFPATFGGSESVTDMLTDYWSVSMEIDSRSGNTAAQLEALINYLQGGEHTAEFGHFVRPTPSGLLPATGSLASLASQGASTVVLTVPTGSSILAGDYFKVGDLLVQAQTDASAVGTVLTVPIVNRLRKSISSGSAVIFDNPTIKFYLDSASSVNQVVGYSGGVSLSFSEYTNG